MKERVTGSYECVKCCSLLVNVGSVDYWIKGNFDIKTKPGDIYNAVFILG